LTTSSPIPDRSSLIQFIRNTIPIDETKALAIANEFSPRQLSKGDIFLKEGKVSDEYLFLETGFLRSYLFDTEGNEVTINLSPPNSIVFEMASFFQRVPAQENIEALTASTGWVLSYAQLNNLFHALPEFRDFGRAVLVKGFIAFNQRTISLINRTAEQRYESLLKSSPQIFQYSPLKYIASYLGITDSSLSRIRKEFSKK